MKNLKLTYFDFDGGRGECIRLALTIGNVPFEDERINRERWAQIKSHQPYCALPVLYVDGVPLAQSNAIARYVGKMTDLYPTDPWQAALCDEVLETVEEVTVVIGATMQLDDEQKKIKRQALVKDPLPIYLKGLARRLEAGGGAFFANQRLSVADLRTCDLIQWLSSGVLDHIPEDFVQQTAPLLAQHCANIKALPSIQAYYSTRPKPS